MSFFRIPRLADLGRWRALPASDRRRLIRAALRLLTVDLRLRFRGFASMASVAAAASAIDRRSARPGDPSAIEPWVRAVDVAARHHLYSMPCVPRALALRSLLAEEGIVTELRIGVRKEGCRLAAHAWIEYRGMPIGEASTVLERFALLAPSAPGEGAKAARDAFC